MVVENRYTLEEYAFEEDAKLKRIYIAGPVSKLPYELAKERFEKARKRLNSAGFHVMCNPITLCEEEWEYDTCMRICIEHLVVCDAIYLQRFWWLSRVARLERKIAIACGMDLIYE